ncbi:MAG: aspartate dehydrogenase domain-containing protein [Candidatus Omnitrophota bacterium]
MKRKTIGIIGCGVIGSALAEDADKNLKDHIERIVLFDVDPQKSSTLVRGLSGAVVVSGIDELVAESDLVLEAATPKVVEEILKGAISSSKDAMIMSVGGILGNEGLLYDASERGIRILVPSGAIAGIDAVNAAKQAGIESATIITRKPPASIKGAPYLSENNIDVDNIKEETVVFEGDALDAIKGFPKNINVSALLSIAGIGPEKTRVKIVISPDYTRNTHEIEIRGKAGTIMTRTENVPSPANPKTSYLAVLSAIASLRGYFDSVRIGT